MAMFGLFKKKEKPVEKKEANAGSEELRALAAKFLPEEMTVLAVTGPTGCASGKEESDELYTVGIALTAWMEEFGEEIHREEVRLITKADATLQRFIAQRLPSDFIVKCKVRPNADGTVFLLTNLPEAAFDPDLKAILEQQKAPTTVELDGVGEFVLNRGLKLFQREADWGEGSMVLCVEENSDLEACAACAREILNARDSWDIQIRERAAAVLLDTVNGYLEQEGEEPISKEEFMQRLTPDTLEIYSADSFHAWYSDDGMVGGSGVEASCSLKLGVTDVNAEV